MIGHGRVVRVSALTLRRLYDHLRVSEAGAADILVPMDPSHGATHDGALLAVLWNEGSLDALGGSVRK